VAAASVQVNIRLDPARHEALVTEAKRQRRTITSVVDEAIEAYLVLVTPTKGKGEK
jgi:predicted HicB family RNase H-like nuclease